MSGDPNPPGLPIVVKAKVFMLPAQDKLNIQSAMFPDIFKHEKKNMNDIEKTGKQISQFQNFW